MSLSVTKLSPSSSLFLFTLWLGLTSAALTVGPRNTVVVRGDSAQLHCQTATSSAAPTWKFAAVDGEGQKFIYVNNKLSPDFRRRNVTVQNGTLHFEAVQLYDAGTYTCQDDGGIGEPHAAWMAVLDGEPVCAKPVTSPGVTIVTCSVTVNASKIHKELESLEVQPIIVSQSASDACSVAGWSVNDTDSSQTTPRKFVVVVTVNTSPGFCSAPSLTLNATTLSGKLASTINSDLPEYRFPLPVPSQDSTRNPPTTTSAARGIKRHSSMFSTRPTTNTLMPTSGDVVHRASTEQILLSFLLLLLTSVVNQRL